MFVEETRVTWLGLVWKYPAGRLSFAHYTRSACIMDYVCIWTCQSHMFKAMIGFHTEESLCLPLSRLFQATFSLFTLWQICCHLFSIAMLWEEENDFFSPICQKRMSLQFLIIFNRNRWPSVLYWSRDLVEQWFCGLSAFFFCLASFWCLWLSQNAKFPTLLTSQESNRKNIGKETITKTVGVFMFAFKQHKTKLKSFDTV